MMKVTIEGPQGCGKTRLGLAIVQWAEKQGLSTVSRDDDQRSKAYDSLFKPDVLIVEKLAS